MEHGIISPSIIPSPSADIADQQLLLRLDDGIHLQPELHNDAFEIAYRLVEDTTELESASPEKVRQSIGKLALQDHIQLYTVEQLIEATGEWYDLLTKQSNLHVLNGLREGPDFEFDEATTEQINELIRQNPEALKSIRDIEKTRYWRIRAYIGIIASLPHAEVLAFDPTAESQSAPEQTHNIQQIAG